MTGATRPAIVGAEAVWIILQATKRDDRDHRSVDRSYAVPSANSSLGLCSRSDAAPAVSEVKDPSGKVGRPRLQPVSRASERASGIIEICRNTTSSSVASVTKRSA